MDVESKKLSVESVCEEAARELSNALTARNMRVVRPRTSESQGTDGAGIRFDLRRVAEAGAMKKLVEPLADEIKARCGAQVTFFRPPIPVAAMVADTVKVVAGRDGDSFAYVFVRGICFYSFDNDTTDMRLDVLFS